MTEYKELTYQDFMDFAKELSKSYKQAPRKHQMYISIPFVDSIINEYGKDTLRGILESFDCMASGETIQYVKNIFPELNT